MEGRVSDAGLAVKGNEHPRGDAEEKFRASITQQARAAHLDRDLHLDLKEGQALPAEEVRRLAGYLNEIAQSKMDVNLHVLGQPPEGPSLVSWIASCLGKRFPDGLGEALAVPPEHDRLPGDRQDPPRMPRFRPTDAALNGEGM